MGSSSVRSAYGDTSHLWFYDRLKDDEELRIIVTAGRSRATSGSAGQGSSSGQTGNAGGTGQGGHGLPSVTLQVDGVDSGDAGPGGPGQLKGTAHPGDGADDPEGGPDKTGDDKKARRSGHAVEPCPTCQKPKWACTCSDRSVTQQLAAVMASIMADVGDTQSIWQMMSTPVAGDGVDLGSMGTFALDS